MICDVNVVLGITAKGGGIDYVEPSDYQPSYRNYTLDQYDQHDNFAYAPREPVRSTPRTIEFNNDYKTSNDSIISRIDEKSVTDTAKSVPTTAPSTAAVEEKQDLLDFAFESTSNPIQYNNDLLGMTTPTPSYAPPPPQYQPPPQQYAPQPYIPQYAQPQYMDNSMPGYNPNISLPPAPPPPQDIPTYHSPAQQPTYTPTGQTYELSNIDESPSNEVDDITKGVSNLVNLEDLTQPAEKKITKLTMINTPPEQKKRSKGLPPTQTFAYGAQPSLREIQSFKKDVPTKEVMRNSMINQNMNYGNNMPQYARYNY